MWNLLSGQMISRKLLMKLLLMIKKIKPAILLLIPFLFLQGISGQGSINMTDYLARKFQNFITAVPRGGRDIYHSDRDEYISGEDLWFNIYVLTGRALNLHQKAELLISNF